MQTFSGNLIGKKVIKRIATSFSVKMTNIHYVFQGAPQDTSYTIDYGCCSPERIYNCNEFPKLSFTYNSFKHAVILDDGRSILRAYHPFGFSQFKMVIKNAMTDEEYCKVYPKFQIFKRTYLATFENHFYTIQPMWGHTMIYYGDPKEDGFEVADLETSWFGIGKLLKIKQNVDPVMMITICLCVQDLERRKKRK
eukprot:NODE_366_length_8705_cov_0.466070.p6 type:complete len:195 gc:universal NODE_366_length_8705_cov_0.466070:5050-5634(+)